MPVKQGASPMMSTTGLFFSFAATGTFGGLLSGLFGAGCGIFLVPALLYLLPHAGVGEEALVHVAIGTSLAILMTICVTNTLAHRQQGNFIKPLVARITPLCCIGAVAGAMLADWIEGDILKILFQAVLLFIAASLLMKNSTTRHLAHSKYWPIAIFSGFLALITSMVGIGISQLLIPILNRAGLPMNKAIATSACSAIPYTLIGAASYIILGLDETLPAHHLGYLNAPAFFSVSLFAIYFTQLGAKFNKYLSEKFVQIGFATLLCTASLSMFFQ
jgi:uncharacterized membrane protein YfcA